LEDKKMDILFDNIVNARDLGGMIGYEGREVRSGMLLRTAHLHDATDEDVRRLREVYHLARVFDFRSLGEAELLPDREIEGATHHLLPTIDKSEERLTGQAIPQEAFLDLERHIEPALRPTAHHWLILHGRYICTARRPKCEDCPLTAWCREYPLLAR
jgi:hypothetical protein